MAGRSIGAVALFFLGNGIMFASWASRIPDLQVQYDLIYQQIGWALLAQSIGALIAMPITGVLIHRYGSRIVVQCTGIAFLCITPFIAFFDSLQYLYLVMIGIGMSTGSMDVAMNAQAVLVEQKTSRNLMSRFHAVFSVGMMIGAGISALAIRYELPLFTQLSISAAILILGVLAMMNGFLKESTERGTNEKTGFKLSMITSSLIVLGLVTFCCMLAEGAMAEWSSSYMKDVLEVTAHMAPYALIAFNVAMVSGRLSGDYLRNEMGDSRLLLIGCILAFSGLMIIVHALYTVLALAGFFLVGIGLATIVPIAYSSGGKQLPDNPGVGISVITTIGYSGFIAGPPIIGLIAGRYGLRFGFIFIGVLMLVAIMLVVYLKAQHRRT